MKIENRMYKFNVSGYELYMTPWARTIKGNDLIWDYQFSDGHPTSYLFDGNFQLPDNIDNPVDCAYLLLKEITLEDADHSTLRQVEWAKSQECKSLRQDLDYWLVSEAYGYWASENGLEAGLDDEVIFHVIAELDDNQTFDRAIKFIEAYHGVK